MSYFYATQLAALPYDSLPCGTNNAIVDGRLERGAEPTTIKCMYRLNGAAAVTLPQCTMLHALTHPAVEHKLKTYQTWHFLTAITAACQWVCLTFKIHDFLLLFHGTAIEL